MNNVMAMNQIHWFENVNMKQAAAELTGIDAREKMSKKHRGLQDPSKTRGEQGGAKVPLTFKVTSFLSLTGMVQNRSLASKKTFKVTSLAPTFAESTLEITVVPGPRPVQVSVESLVMKCR